jgi:hypothetical protein
MSKRQPDLCIMLSHELLEKRLCLSTGGVEFVEVIDNPYLPLTPGATYIYRGADEQSRAIRSRVTVTGDTRVFDGVTTTAVRERRYLDGVLERDTYSFYAQDVPGNVWSFPDSGDEPSIVMPAEPRVGEAEVLAISESVKTPFAHFADCVTIRDSSTAQPTSARQSQYTPGVGMVMSQSAGSSEFLRLAYVSLAPEAFSDTIDNPYLPLKPGTTLIYRGVDAGVPIRLRVNVTTETKQITGVSTTVVRDRQYENGELVEDTTSYYAQDKAGNVWSFGELGEQIEDGVVVSTEGSWEAGIDGAMPTLFMRARPAVGDFYRLGALPGVAEDEARVLRSGELVKIPYGTFTNALVMEDSSPLEPEDVELKFYVPGIGFVGEQTISGGDEIMRLAYVLDEPAS